jgi:hypothetical protein
MQSELLKFAAGAGAAALLSIATAAGAHAIWFAQRSTHTALIYGIGADDLDIVKRFNLVEQVNGYDAQLKPLPTKLTLSGPLALIEAQGDPAVVSAVMYNKVWSKPRDGGEWVEGGRDVLPNALVSEKNYKFTVYLRHPLSGPVPAFPDQRLQIIPVGAIPEKKGAPLKLKVVLGGKPLAGAKVLADFVNDPDAKPVATGPDGTVTVKVRNQGLNVINAVTTVPSDEPKRIDHIEYEATLSFALTHEPE